jgi:uncharacterized repeat protein (TIGR03803 family)
MRRYFADRSLKFSLCAIGLLAATVAPAHADAFGITYTFQGGSDGAYPVGNLIKDKAGNLYGVTEGGGGYIVGACDNNGCGTVYTISPQGAESVLHVFTGGSDGGLPEGSLRFDNKGNLDGTATYGGYTGPNCIWGDIGCGEVFQLTPGGTVNTLYDFDQNSSTDGFNPESGLVTGAGGTRYGTTFLGGSCTDAPYGCGTIFSIKGKVEKTLYAFTDTGDGANPIAPPIADAAGNLYGTTQGGNGIFGILYKLAPDGALTVLHTFTGSQGDGAVPLASLMMDASGNLYGTTSTGGANGGGTVFEYALDGTYSIIHAFSGSDGEQPRGALIMDGSGHLYGTTAHGGASCFGGFAQCGTVYEINRNGLYVVLHTFTGGSDGAFPTGSLVFGPGGYVYGTASQGGNLNCNRGLGCGTVFRVARFP